MTVAAVTEQELTWADLVREEPRLAMLAEEIRRIKRQRGKPFCANACWYGYGGWPGFKARMDRLVGWHGENPKLRSMAAFDEAYDYLYRLLPDCYRCGCL